jgi:signal transduction histidine kinase
VELLAITTTGWVALSIALSMLVLAGFLFVLGRERFHYIWGAFCVAVALWAGGFYMVTLVSDPELAKMWWKVSFSGLILNPFLFLHFVLEFAKNTFYRLYTRTVTAVLYAVALFFLVVNLATDLIIRDVTLLFGELYYNTPPGPLHPYFTALFCIIIFFSLYIVYREYQRQTNDIVLRQRAMYLLIAALIAYIGGGMNFLVVYEINIPPITNFTVAFGSAFIAYAILRYRLFDVRVVAAQFLTFILLGFVFIRLAVSVSYEEVVFNALMLFVTAVVGVYLVNSVRKEVEQREEIQRLATELQDKNTKLTELDTLKSQFLSIATHELRTPITIVRNFVSLMLDGTYGKIPPAAEVAARQVFERATDMAQSVDSYLNVSRIEQGKMQYTFTTVDITRLTKLAVDGMKANAEKKSLALSLTIKPGAEGMQANADGPKISEVLVNLIDNSIKYTLKGSVAVTVEMIGKVGRITLTDTGVGMTPKTLQGLFKLFSPGEDAKKINVSSTGIGMYISKMHVEAHKGTLNGYSGGEGKGSQFVLDLPLLS